MLITARHQRACHYGKAAFFFLGKKYLVDFCPLIERKVRKVEKLFIKIYICACFIIRKNIKNKYTHSFHVAQYAWVSDNRNLCLSLYNWLFTFLFALISGRKIFLKQKKWPNLHFTPRAVAKRSTYNQQRGLGG